MDSADKRLYLRVAAKLLLLILLLGMAYALLRSLPGSGTAPPLSRVELRGLEPGQLLRYDWQGKRILILRREAYDEHQLAPLSQQLLDPDGYHSRQPDDAAAPLRSEQADYFVALDYGTDLNCPLDYIGAQQQGPEDYIWLGGFRDRCRGSWYDLAGRVYLGQQAKRNLSVPPYHIEGQTLLLGVAD